MPEMRSLQQILLVDDDPNDRLLATRQLKREFPNLKIQEATNWEQFESALEEDSFDLVITDYDLRWSNGLDVLRAVKDHYPDRPVVMFTDSGTQEIAVEAMKAGLEDYVLKSPKHLIRLSQAVRSAWEKTQVHRKAAELEIQLKFLLNELNVGFFRASLAGELLEASDGLKQLLGIDSLEAIQAFFERHQILHAVERQGQQQWHHEIKMENHHQRTLWLQVSETLAMSNGTARIDGLINDITKQKETAAELQAVNETLEQRVAQRTARLEMLNKELEMFAFSVSHDLRSPIRQIDGFALLLEQELQESSAAIDDIPPATASDGSISHYVRRIRLLTDRAGQMIDDLLQFSRTGRAEMQYTNVSMNRLVQEVVKQLQPLTAERQIEWQIESLPSVWGDRNLLRKVWQNLIENAVKYTRQQTVAIIKIGSKNRENETAFFVQDNGIGFDMEEAETLFGVFQRLPNAEDFDGTGIGLANVQRVIHRHRGRLWTQGKLNAGATFYFSIPDGMSTETNLVP